MVRLKDSPRDAALLAVILVVGVAAIWQRAWVAAALAFLLFVVAERQADIVLSMRGSPGPDPESDGDE